MSKERFSYKAQETAYQRGYMTPQLVERHDTPEFRHYLNTVGSPPLKAVLDHFQKQRSFSEIKEENGEYITELLKEESSIQSQELFELFLLMAENKELKAKLSAKEKENAYLEEKFEQLQESISQEKNQDL